MHSVPNALGVVTHHLASANNDTYNLTNPTSTQKIKQGKEQQGSHANGQKKRRELHWLFLAKPCNLANHITDDTWRIIEQSLFERRPLFGFFYPHQ